MSRKLTAAEKAVAKDRQRAREKAWREANREHLRAYDKARAEDPKYQAAARERKRKYATTHPARVKLSREQRKDRKRETTSAWEQRNRDHVNAKSRAWRSRNKSKVLVWQQNAQARRRGAVGKYDRADIERLRKLQFGRCPICRDTLNASAEVDHILPIALGGTNWPDNLQILCRPCNRRKSKTHPVEFMQRIGKLL